jgi:1-deoxy-D-xylulose-5-phosphate synthase
VAEGYKPFAAIYSTFCSALKTRSCMMLRSRASPCTSQSIGADGPTHRSFDLSFLGCLPGFVIMATADEAELVP